MMRIVCGQIWGYGSFLSVSERYYPDFEMLSSIMFISARKSVFWICCSLLLTVWQCWQREWRFTWQRQFSITNLASSPSIRDRIEIATRSKSVCATCMPSHDLQNHRSECVPERLQIKCSSRLDKSTVSVMIFGRMDRSRIYMYFKP